MPTGRRMGFREMMWLRREERRRMPDLRKATRGLWAQTTVHGRIMGTTLLDRAYAEPRRVIAKGVRIESRWESIPLINYITQAREPTCATLGAGEWRPARMLQNLGSAQRLALTPPIDKANHLLTSVSPTAVLRVQQCGVLTASDGRAWACLMRSHHVRPCAASCPSWSQNTS